MLNPQRRVAALAAVILFGQACHADDLRPGLKAPEIKVGEWLKGNTFEGYSKTDLTVVEFWATWCGPCIEMMPHLTKMAKKHEGKVAFYGVSVREGTGKDVPQKVKGFVEKNSANMGYNIARDTTDDFMARMWLDSASQFAIPSTFVVDKSGTLIWIGHPSELSKLLDQALAGTFNKAKFAKDFKEQIDKTKRFVALMDACSGAEKLYLSGNKTEALAKLDAAAAVTDDEKALKKISRLQMFMYEPQKASAFIDKVMKEHKKADAWALVQLAHVLKADSSSEMKEIALKALDQGVSLDPKNPNILLIAGNAWMKHGNKKRALEMAVAGQRWLPKSEFKDSENTKQSLADLKKSAGG